MDRQPGVRAFRAPSRYVQGPGVLDQIGDHAARFGSRLGVILSDGTRGRLGAKIAASLASANTDVTYARFGGECSHEEISLATAALGSANINAVVGLGGGKALDTAKMTAWRLGVPCVLIPTVASNDAPTSAAADIYDRRGTWIEGVSLPRNPDLVLVDTAIVADAPVKFLIAGMGDALSTRFEARACLSSGALTDAGGHQSELAGSLASLCYDLVTSFGAAAISDVVEHRVTESVERVVEATTLLSGLGWESGGLAAAHAIHNGLTAASGTHGVLHGEKVAFGTIAQLILESQSGEAQEVAEFCLSVGLPVQLRDIGIQRDDQATMDAVARKATLPSETIHNMPFPVSKEDVKGAILGADRLGAEVAFQREGELSLHLPGNS